MDHFKKRAQLFYIILILIFTSNIIFAELNVSLDLPEKIQVKTPSQTFTVDYYFALYDGKIFYKRNQEILNPELIYERLKDQDPKDFNEWRLLEPNGIPFSECEKGVPGLPNPQPPKTEDFKVPSGIKEISADNSMLVALSEDNHFYYCYLNDGSKFFKIRGWTDRWGKPKQELYYTEKFKKWEIGRRSEKVEWFEDPDGYKRSYSGYGLSMLYALTKDGRDIYFVDNGMPQSFHDIIAGPENGEFIAENLSVSGDTIFLIDKYGNMYTRLADFDTIGDDIMLYKYTYQSIPLKKPEKNNGKNFINTQFSKEYLNVAVKLPPEPWRKQEPIPTGKGFITKKITIMTTGKGNTGRELRVIGTDTDDNSGYYYKQIYDSEWKFKKMNTTIYQEDILNCDHTKINKGKTVRKNYRGRIKFSNSFKIDADLENFTSKYAPSTIAPAVIKMKINDEIVELKLHMVNSWKPIFNPREYPYHEPRVFMGTLEFPESINTSHAKFNKKMKRLYKRYHLKEFRFVVEAGENYVRIHQKNGPKYHFVMNFVKENMMLSDIESRPFLKPFLEENNQFQEMVRNEEIIVDDLQNIDNKNEFEYLNKVLNKNKQIYNEMYSLRKISKQNMNKTRIRAFGFRIIQGFFLATGTVFIPESMHFFKHMGMLFKIQSRQNTQMYLLTRKDFYESKKILKRRIGRYSKQLNKYQNKASHYENGS